MRRSLILCLTAACVMAPAVMARSLDDVVEPAMMMQLDFGGGSRPEFGVGLRLNYSTPVRQALGMLSVNPETSLESFESGIGSRLLDTPALAQLDFNRHGFRKASLAGLPLVTRHLRLNQTEETASEEAPAEETSSEEAPAEEEWVWYDYSQWGWRSWSLVGLGAVGIYLLVDSGKSDPAPSSTPPPEGCPEGQIENPLPPPDCIAI